MEAIGTSQQAAQPIPAWMERAARKPDRVLLLVVLLSLVPALSFLLHPGLPRVSDLERYGFRTQNVVQGLRDGWLYPRWAANAELGYGAPILQFEPPLPAYLPSVLVLFVTGDIEPALRLSLIALIAGAAIFSYLWVRSAARPAAAITATALYIFSPVMSLTIPRITGDLSALTAAALLPAWLWTVSRQHSPASFVLSAAVFSALLLTSPVSAALGAAAAATFLSLSAGRVGRLGWLTAILLLSIAVTACFWLPAIAEQSAIDWRAQPNTYDRAFSLIDLVGIAQPIDHRLLNPPAQFGFGLPLLLAIALSIVSLAVSKARRTFFVVNGALGIGTILIWHVDGSNRFDLMAACVLFAAVFASRFTVLFQSGRRQLIGLPASLAVISLLNLPLMARLDTTTSLRFDPPAEVSFERRGFGTAMVPAAGDVATALPADTEPDASLIAGIESGDILKLSAVGSDATNVGVLAHTSHSDRFQLYGDAPAEMEILTAYFPGWTATFAGKPVPVAPSPNGLLNISIPSGSGELSVWLGATPVRNLAWAITAVGIVGVIAAAVPMRGRRRSERTTSTGTSPGPGVWIACGGVVLAAAGLTALQQLSHTSDAGLPSSIAGTQVVDWRSDLGLELSAFRIEGTPISGQWVRITSYWRAVRYQSEIIQMQFVVINRAGSVIDSTPFRWIGDVPAPRWTTQHWVQDMREIDLPDVQSAGELQIVARVRVCRENCESAPAVAFFSARGDPLPDDLPLN